MNDLNIIIFRCFYVLSFHSSPRGMRFISFIRWQHLHFQKINIGWRRWKCGSIVIHPKKTRIKNERQLGNDDGPVYVSYVCVVIGIYALCIYRHFEAFS
jgi:hypothetical protein